MFESSHGGRGLLAAMAWAVALSFVSHAALASSPFGLGVTLLSPAAKPFLTGDFDGDGVPDSVWLVRVAPRAAGRAVASDVIVANPWEADAQALRDKGEALAIVIESGRAHRRYLLHTGYFDPETGISQTSPLALARRGGAVFRSFARQAPAVRNDILVMGTPAGIDIALYWNGSRYAVFWPNEEP